MKTQGQLKIGAVMSYITIAFNIVVGLIYTPWMIDIIGKNDYGIYVLANSIITLFLVDFGLSSATSRFVAKYRAANDVEGMQIFLNILYRLYLLIDAVILFIFILFFLNLDLIYNNLSGAELEKFKIVFCISASYSLISFPCVTFNGILNAYEKFISLKLADMLYKVGSVCINIVALCLGYGLYAIVTINAIIGVAAIIVKLNTVRKSVRFRFKSISANRELYGELFGFSIWSTIWGLAQRLIFTITPSILGIVTMDAASEIAIFGIIITLESFICTITTALNGMFMSRITRIVNKDSSREELTDLAVKVGRFQFALNGIIVLGFFLIGKEFMVLWMGTDYIDAYYGTLFVIVPGLFFNSLQIANTALIVQNKVKYQAIVVIVVGVLNVILSLLFSHLWGAFGAALSICIAYFIRVILTIEVVRMKLNFDLKRYIKECYVKMSIPLISTLIVCLPIAFWKTITWGDLLIESMLICIVYSMWILLLGTTKSEKKNLKIILKRIF